MLPRVKITNEKCTYLTIIVFPDRSGDVLVQECQMLKKYWKSLTEHAGFKDLIKLVERIEIAT